jgi:hypothetical protein
MMKDETKLIENVQNNSQSKDGKSAGWSKAAYAAAGFVGGVATGAGAQAVLGADDEHAQIDPAQLELPSEADVPETEPTTIDISPVVDAPAEPVLPAPSDVIMVTGGGVRVAQISGGMTFDEAFADAREQVGAGGVFTWKGKLHNTYYKEEWEAMTSAERQDYHSRVGNGEGPYYFEI